MNKSGDCLTNNDIIELIENDDIDRNKYLTKMLNIFNNNGLNRIYSLNGGWGTGKTIFIKKFILLMNYCSIYNEMECRKCIYNPFNENEPETTLNRLNNISKKAEFKEFKKISEENVINAIYYNAWEHDDESDPILSIIYALIKNYNLNCNTNYYQDDLLDKIAKLTKIISNGKIDFTSSSNIDILEELKIKEEKQEIIDDIMNQIIPENSNKLILFIDELDRCNPNYAVKLLERIKHYFNNERLIIVITTNLNELSKVISTFYGKEFLGYKYLDKFFDMKLELPKVNAESYINTFDMIINKEKNAYFSIIVNDIIRYKKFEMREIQRYLSLIRQFEEYIFNGNSAYHYRQHGLNRFLFIPYIIGLYVDNINDYNNFVNGNDITDFINFIKKSETAIQVCKIMFFDRDFNREKTEEELFDCIKTYYDYIYGSNVDSHELKDILNIGEIHLLKKDILKIRNSISLLCDINYFQ